MEGAQRRRLIQIKQSRDRLPTLDCTNLSEQGAMARRNSCVDCVVRNSALCRVLPAQRLAELNHRSYVKRYPAGQLVGAAEDCIAIVRSGVIKLTKSLADGRQQIVALLFPSDLLGRPFRTGTTYDAETATAVELCCFGRECFENLMQEQVELKQLFLERTLDELEAAREWMLLLGRSNAQEKVAALIFIMWQRMGAPDCESRDRSPCRQFDLPLSRSEMADYLGLRIETVSRQLKLLRAAGAIEIGSGRTILVQDVRALERMMLSVDQQAHRQ
jgi:CRP/FNR family transcriptional regulator